MILIDPLVVEIRATKGSGEYGEVYEWGAIGVQIAHGVIEIRLAMTAPSPSVWRDLYKTLRAYGWKKVVFTRMRPGNQPEKHEVDLEIGRHGRDQ